MRSLLLGGLVAALALTVAAQHVSTLDDRLDGEFRIKNLRFLNPCAGTFPIDQIARKAHVPFGFEGTADCWLSPSGWDSAEDGGEVLEGMAARQAFDHLMALIPAYRWKEMDGVAVVRPQAAWDNPADVLTLPAASFTVTNGSLNTALHMALRSVTPFVLNPHEDLPPLCGTIDLPVSVEFRRGSMLDALNAVVRAHQGAEWELGYRANHATITVREFCASGGTGATTLYFRTHARGIHRGT